MGRSPGAREPGLDKQLFIAGRWEEFEAERTVNRLRVVAIGLFYVVELVNYHGLKLGFLELPPQKDVDERFHVAVSALALAWVMAAVAVHFCLGRRVFPWFLKYFSTAVDLVLLTCVLLMAAGPASPLTAVYFLVLLAAGLRLDRGLVRCATAGAVAGYVVLLGQAKWFEPGDSVPRYHQAIFLLALVLSGVVLGQIVGRAGRLAREVAERMEAEGGE